MGIVGFCWGGIPVLLASQNDKIKYGITFHPSFSLLK
jgi:dienelactone hydrolase